ncbi:MAG: flagellar basal body-associated FliL family protein [Gallionella sp.]
MATAAKPGAGKGASATDKNDAPAVKGGKKKLVFIILALLLVGGGGAAAYYFLMKPADSAKEVKKAAPAPKYVALGTFTANLVHEDSDRYLQTAITIKITKPELEEQIKAKNPEILDHLNMLLSSQRPSVLATIAGKQKLARDIKAQIEMVLGLRSGVPENTPVQPASAPLETQPPQPDTGINEVLFTSFIIQ